MEKSNKKSLSEYAETLFRKQQLSQMTVEEIERELDYMINNKDTGRNWYRTAVFVYNFGGYNFSKVFEIFKKATGYGRSALYNFKKAGEIIYCEEWSEQDVGDKTIAEFLDLNKKTANGCITNIQQIGSYVYDINFFSGKLGDAEYYIYKGKFENHIIYFCSDRIINNDIELRICYKKDKKGKRKEIKEFYCNDEKVELGYFEPSCYNDVNLKRV